MKLKEETLGRLGIHVEDWDIERPFKRLTITTDYTNWITYISRKDVPEHIYLTDLRYWKPIAKLQTSIAADYNKLKEEVADIKKIMTTFLKQTDIGAAFSDHLGDNPYVGVSQKGLTDVIQRIYVELENITGEALFNTTITINPEEYVEAESPNVDITIVSDLGVLDYVKIYFNNVLVDETGATDSFEKTLSLTKTTIVKVETSVLGKVYTKEQTLAVISDLYIGSGQTPEDVLIPEYAQVFTGNPRGRYEFTCKQDDKIIVILPTISASEVEQIEMNDFNIPMETSIYDKYTVFTSVNTYDAGTYNLDINY